MTGLSTLAGRVEAGTVEMQRELLEAAFKAVHGQSSYWVMACGEREAASKAWEFREKLAAEAYVDAGVMLKPHQLRLMLSEWDDEVHLRHKGPWQAVLSRPGCDASFDAMRGYRCDHAATAALALAAACLRAHASEATNV